MTLYLTINQQFALSFLSFQIIKGNFHSAVSISFYNSEKVLLNQIVEIKMKLKPKGKGRKRTLNINL